MKYRMCLTLLLSMLILNGYAQTGANYQALIDQFVANSTLKGAQISISIIDVSTNRLVASQSPKEQLIPASSLKAVTTASAMLILGKNYRYTTRLSFTGEIRNGILNGNLILEGSGDPSLASRRIKDGMSLEDFSQQILDAVRQKGIRQINGSVIVNEMAFDPQDAVAPSWEEKDMGNYYGSGVWGFNLHDNLYQLHFRQNTQTGSIPKTEGTNPNIEGLVFKNQVRLAGPNTGDNAYIYGKPYQFNRRIEGTIPSGSGRFTILGSIPDPPLFGAQLIAKTLQEGGISLSGGGTTVFRQRQQIGNDQKLVKAWNSKPLAELITLANVYSDNLYCEAFLRTIGMAQTGNGRRENSIQRLKELWTNRGLDMATAVLEDGSGLSTRNQISSKLLASIIRKAYIDKHIGQTFLQSLPNTSNSTYLERKYKGTAAAGKLFAKSGSMEGVRSYSGLFKGKNGKWYAFSILVNQLSKKDNKTRSLMEDMMLNWCK